MFTHTVDEEVGTGVDEDGGHEFVLPIVIMGESAHGGLDTADDDRYIGIELLEDPAVGDGAVIGSHTGFTVRCIGIVGTTSLGGGVMVDHRVHRTGRDGKIEFGTTELLEIPEVAMPIGLGHYGDAVSGCFECPTDDGCCKRGMIDIRIAGEEDNVHFIPAA